MKFNRTPLTVVLVSVLALGSSGAMAQAGGSAPASETSGTMHTAAGAAAKQTPNDTAAPASRSDRVGQTGSEHFIRRQESSQVLADSLIGMTVRDGPNKDDKEIGKVTDLILDAHDHRLVGVVVGVGGFLGMGHKDVAIPWKELASINKQDKTAEVKMTKEQLERAPEFRTEKEQRADSRDTRTRVPDDMRVPVGSPPPATAPKS
jgi:sporulation protein YlmC with PRC-barrel domain